MALTQTPEWQALQQHQQRLASTHLRELFAQDAHRFQHFSLELDGLLLDYSKQRIDSACLQSLIALAEQAQVSQWRDRMFAGEAINVSERRAVLHTALRAPKEAQIPKSEQNLMPQIHAVREQMRSIVHAVRSGAWLGYQDQAITDVVNIGIGGSDLGPKMATQALSRLQHPSLRVHYVSNLDGAHIAPLLTRLNPSTTLFIIASKTFTTQETMINAHTARAWILASARTDSAIAQHFIAVTSQTQRAELFGIASTNILQMWDWVGGRYSLWSAVGLSVAFAVGMDAFEDMLAGAHCLDQHFCSAPFEKNLPVLLALISVWNTNFLGAETTAVLPYNESMRYLPAYLQQLEMESNGKTVDRHGQQLTCRTNPIIWGEIGVNGQHAFFQLLHQGGWLIPCDFVLAANSDFPLSGHQGPLLANCLAQSAALAFGKTEQQALQELAASNLDTDAIAHLLPHKVFAGNQPSSTLLIPELSPFHLGMLLALYEHKVFVQGVIWGINSFDQWGVELGKQLAQNLLPALDKDFEQNADLDDSTRGLIAYLKSHKGE
jgi:glucose-6-phosphate isomerase